MMLRIGTRLTNDKKNIDLLVCHVSCCRRFTALYDLNGFDPKKNLSKPEAWRMDDVLAYITSHSLQVERFDYPVVMTRSDDWIATEMGKGTWLDDSCRSNERIDAWVDIRGNHTSPMKAPYGDLLERQQTQLKKLTLASFRQEPNNPQPDNTPVV